MVVTAPIIIPFRKRDDLFCVIDEIPDKLPWEVEDKFRMPNEKWSVNPPIILKNKRDGVENVSFLKHA